MHFRGYFIEQNFHLNLYPSKNFALISSTDFFCSLYMYMYDTNNNPSLSTEKLKLHPPSNHHAQYRFSLVFASITYLVTKGKKKYTFFLFCTYLYRVEGTLHSLLVPLWHDDVKVNILITRRVSPAFVITYFCNHWNTGVYLIFFGQPVSRAGNK